MDVFWPARFCLDQFANIPCWMEVSHTSHNGLQRFKLWIGILIAAFFIIFRHRFTKLECDFGTPMSLKDYSKAFRSYFGPKGRKTKEKQPKPGVETGLHQGRTGRDSKIFPHVCSNKFKYITFHMFSYASVELRPLLSIVFGYPHTEFWPNCRSGVK